MQIDITNACHHRCSNCTRFCGHHVKPFFMDFETFKRAVDSLRDYPGVVGIIGGEPTLHPEFRRFAEYFRDNFGTRDVSARMTAPTENFLDHVTHHNSYATRRGLWSSVSKQYYEHFETIQDVFSLQLLNDHNGPGTHQPLMVTRGELGIPDEQWFPLRDACWVQNIWSASITPKGAFFCEVAAAMDATLGGPGGWDIEPGWWLRTPDQFGEQLQWCELCSAPLAMPKRLATDEMDDISPKWRQMLEDIQSPKLAKGLTSLFDLSAYGTPEFAAKVNDKPWLYLDAQDHRMGEKIRSHLKPHSMTTLLELSEGVDATAAMQQLKINSPNDMSAVVLAGTDVQIEIVRRAGITCFDTRELDPCEIFSRLSKNRRTEDWILHCRDFVVTPGVGAVLANHSFNLGCLYLVMVDEPGGYAQFFNLRALSLGGDADPATLRDRYPEDKVVGVQVNAETRKSVALPRTRPCSAARRLTLATPDTVAPA